MPNDPPLIHGLTTGTAGFGSADMHGLDTPELFTNWADFERRIGAVPAVLSRMVRGFFDNGGTQAYVASTLGALEAIDEVSLLCPLPEDTDAAIAQCELRRDRVAILSLPAGLHTVDQVLAARPPQASGYAVVHHPWVWVGGVLTPPGGHVSGIYSSGASAAATPTTGEMRGLDDPPLERLLTQQEIEMLVGAGINPLRDLRAAGRGVRVWSARTLDPDPELRYLPVRRLLIFLETSIQRGLQWVAFEPNDEALWSRVRDAVDAFLLTQQRTGALKGRTPDEAFFVRCDRTTMTQDDIDNGRLICLIGVAAVRPAEFVIFKIGQRTAIRCC